MSGYHIQFLGTYSVIFLRATFAENTEFCEVPHRKSNTQDWLPFFVYVLNKLHTFSTPHISLFRLVQHEPFCFLSPPMNHFVLSPLSLDGQLDSSSAVIRMASGLDHCITYANMANTLNPPMSDNDLHSSLTSYFKPRVQQGLICRNPRSTQYALAFLAKLQGLEDHRDTFRSPRRVYDRRDTNRRHPRDQEKTRGCDRGKT
jgi:hypothetical protein